MCLRVVHIPNRKRERERERERFSLFAKWFCKRKKKTENRSWYAQMGGT